ncbi:MULTISPECIES: DUF6572 domain-containing protein [unclassified Flavobacterium]|uniref:DUF6572 domain-containing protein n=1 Tax=unclassified Flavobacterium TaxID=196869 RepID=UPI00096351C3|nr:MULTISPECIES: DUF6572 domain-containing protein [unclassified Flavobacterium]MBN9284089.1 hypothetical protein [Flavobacterium sp.]OJV71104.1 MAG: hypothetical protein BGO42_04635 [Flavobacterium sp. 40-81]
MAVDNKDVIDAVSINTEGKVVLTISDHLEWNGDENNHILILQEKINSYLDFVEGDQIIESYPQAIGKQFVIQVVFKYSPSSDGILFLNEVENILKENGYVLHYYVLTNED